MKAILVVDMQNCENCLLNIDGLCAGTREPIHSIGCPLKPMPQKKEAYAESYTERAYELSAKTHPLYADGWNDCLEEIENESKECV